jgi:hypothetical protein
MSYLSILERKTNAMKRVDVDNDEVLQILDRLEKLSVRPENPGVGYRNLETINALVNTLREKLQIKVNISG